jgi:hypothetical protein
MDIDKLVSAGFFYTNLGDVVRCAFCNVEVGRWEKGDDPMTDHLRWSPSCGFAKGLNTGNIPTPSAISLQQPGCSNPVCEPHVAFTSNTGLPKSSKYIFKRLFILVRIIISVW